MNNQENSFMCIKCKVYYTEESNAYEGFICEDCSNLNITDNTI